MLLFVYHYKVTMCSRDVIIGTIINRSSCLLERDQPFL